MTYRLENSGRTCNDTMRAAPQAFMMNDTGCLLPGARLAFDQQGAQYTGDARKHAPGFENGRDAPIISAAGASEDPRG